MNQTVLTPKQEKFCQCIVSGMSKKDSYKTAYNCNSDRVASNESTVLLKRDDITARIKELNKPVINHAQNVAISEYERIKTLLWDRIQYCIENNDDSSIVKYTDQINKMNQTYININKNIDDTPKELINLNTDELKQLLQ
jgi:phage terminase small subunit